MAILESSLRKKREEIVVEHMESENRHEFDATIETFDHPRYEIVPTGDVYDGEEEVRAYFAQTREAFPDQRNKLVRLHHVVVGGRFGVVRRDLRRRLDIVQWGFDDIIGRASRRAHWNERKQKNSEKKLRRAERLQGEARQGAHRGASPDAPCIGCWSY